MYCKEAQRSSRRHIHDSVLGLGLGLRVVCSADEYFKRFAFWVRAYQSRDIYHPRRKKIGFVRNEELSCSK